MSSNARQAVEVGRGSQRQNQVVELELEPPAHRAVFDHDPPRLQVDDAHVAVVECHSAERGPKGADDMLGFDGPRDDFGQHRREEQKILVADERDLDGVIAAEAFLERPSRVHPREPAAQHQNAFCDHRGSTDDDCHRVRHPRPQFRYTGERNSAGACESLPPP